MPKLGSDIPGEKFRPTVPGYYWWNGTVLGGDWRIIEVVPRYRDGVLMLTNGMVSFPLSEMPGEFRGPIEPPSK